MRTPRTNAVARIFAERREARRQATPVDAATPPASPFTEVQVQDKIPYLFVQSFQSGTLAPTDDPDRHTLTLEGGLGQTVYFSDRPGRDVGVTPTPRFLQALGFPDENPPNAALLVDAGDGQTDLAVVELFDPVYDEATHTATYQVRGLAAWEDGLTSGLQQEGAGLDGIASEFGTAHLLIDDCSEGPITCGSTEIDIPPQYLNARVPYCYWPDGHCIPCGPYRPYSPPDPCDVVAYWTQGCNEVFPDICNGQCRALFQPDTRDRCGG